MHCHPLHILATAALFVIVAAPLPAAAYVSLPRHSRHVPFGPSRKTGAGTRREVVRLRARHPSQSQHPQHLPTDQQEQDVKHPVVVVGNAQAALGAALALAARDCLRNFRDDGGEGPQRPSSPASTPLQSPPAQPVALVLASEQRKEGNGDDGYAAMDASLRGALHCAPFCFERDEYPSVDDVREVLSSSRRESGTNPILHVSNCNLGAGVGDAPPASVLPLVDSVIRDSISFLGLDLDATLPLPDRNGGVSASEEVTLLGNRLQKILDGGSSPATIITDISVHLAMLRANCLPKSTTLDDSWMIRNSGGGASDNDDGDGSMFIEYSFDYSNPFGGADPLSCPSLGYLVPPPKPPRVNGADDAHAAAYTALRGSGTDPVLALCVANSVRGALLEFGDDCCRPLYTWDVIEWIALCSRQLRESVVAEKGLIRRKYIEYGYK